MRGVNHSTIEIRFRAVDAVLSGMSIVDVATAYQTDRSTVHRWMSRYRKNGEQGLLRKEGSGRPRSLESVSEDQWRRIVLKPASEFGFETDFWTCARIRQVLRERFSVEVSVPTIWRRLRDAGLTYQKPEREYFEKNDQKRDAWLREKVPEIRETVQKHRALLYFQDECNVSLTAFLARTWAPCGKTPKMKVTGKRGGVAALSAINPRGQLLFVLHEKRIASAEVIHFLDQMLRHHKTRHVVVVMDNARPHTSQATSAYIQSQARLHVFYLPSYSPDWNPDEKVWNHLKHQELKGHQAKTKEELTALANNKLARMSTNPELVRGIFFRCCIADLFQ
jgi:transposase